MRRVFTFLSLIVLFASTTALAGILLRGSGGGGGTVSQTGSVTEIASHDQSDSQSVTVPIDATVCVVMAIGFDTTDDWMTGTPISLDGSNLITEQVSDDTDNNGHHWIGYLVNPSTGSQTLAWSWATAPDEGVNMCVVFYKGVDTGDPIRDSGQDISGDDVTGLTANTGDMIVGCVYDYDSTPTVTDDGQTELAVMESLWGAGAGFAQEADEGDWYSSDTAYASAAAMVLKHL